MRKCNVNTAKSVRGEGEARGRLGTHNEAWIEEKYEAESDVGEHGWKSFLAIEKSAARELRET